MNYRGLSWIFLFISLCTGCSSQSKPNRSKPEKDTARIYIYGAIRDNKTKETIPFATYALFPTDTGGVWQGSVRRGMSDNLGNYKIDITSLTDSTNILVIRSKYIRYALTHIIVKGKIKKSIPVDIEEAEGNGDLYRYYKVSPKNSRLKLEKEVNKVRGS